MVTRPAKIRASLTPARMAWLVLLPLLGAVATYDAWADMLHIALRDEESSHAFLVPLVVGWLVWVRRRRLEHCRCRGMLVGPLIMAAGLCLYCAGDRWLIQSFWHGGAVIVCAGCLITVLGRDVLAQFLPAAAAMLFVVPIPGRVRQRIAIPMETATAEVTQRIYETVGVQVERCGNMLSVNGVDVAIAEACNGLRMVAALVMVSYTFAFGTPLRWYVRLIVIALSPASAVACNVARLVPTVWLYGYHPGDAAQRFHDASGWVMLFVSFLMLLGVIRVLRWALVPVNQYVLAYD